LDRLKRDITTSLLRSLCSLPEELQARLKAMPAKAIYILASRKAPIEQKVEVVKNCSHETADDLIAYFRTFFGGAEPKVPSASKILSLMEKSAFLLVPHQLDTYQRNRLGILIDRLQEVFDLSEKKTLS